MFYVKLQKLVKWSIHINCMFDTIPIKKIGQRFAANLKPKQFTHTYIFTHSKHIYFPKKSFKLCLHLYQLPNNHMLNLAPLLLFIHSGFSHSIPLFGSHFQPQQKPTALRTGSSWYIWCLTSSTLTTKRKRAAVRMWVHVVLSVIHLSSATQ